MRTIDEFGISPAPWKENCWKTNDDCGHDITLSNDENNVVAMLNLCSENKERKANARLIAAAPELYETL